MDSTKIFAAIGIPSGVAPGTNAVASFSTEDMQVTLDDEGVYPDAIAAWLRTHIVLLTGGQGGVHV